jgi:hypothetical protein
MRNKTLIIAAGLALFGCDLARDQTSAARIRARGVPSTIEALSSQEVRASRDALVEQLVADTGLTSEPALGDERWAVVFRAGVHEVGRQCDMYLDALFRFNREQRAARQGLSAVAGTTGAILGLTNAATSTLAITAASLGLAGSLFDAGVNSVLFAMEPSAVRNVVLQGRHAFLDSVDQRKITSRPDMLIYLQGYLSQCSPAAIEANVNNAANGSPNAVTIGTAAQRQSAALLAAPAVSLLQRAQQVAGREGAATPTRQQAADVRPPGWRQGDRPNITQTDVRRLQVALGVTPATGALDDTTRAAITEFQLGSRRRFGEGEWPTVDGTLSSNTLRTIAALGIPRADSPLRGAFERALLGDDRRPPAQTLFAENQIDVARQLVTLMGGSRPRFDDAATAVQADQQRAAVLREAIALARRRPDAPAPIGDPAWLDSELFRFVRNAP